MSAKVIRLPTNFRSLQHFNDRLRTGYRFIDKDPIIELVMSVIKQSGLTFKQVSVKTGVSVTTLYNWDAGTTRRPQNPTVEIILRELGYVRPILSNSEYADFLAWRRIKRNG